MAVLPFDLASGRPASAWTYDGNLEGGARAYTVAFAEKDPASRKPGEGMVNGSTDADLVNIFISVTEGGVESLEELIEGFVESYEIDEDETGTPQFTLQGRDSLKNRLLTFFPTEPITYEGRKITASGSLGASAWTFQEIAADICTRASVTRVRFLCPDFMLGNDLVWSTDMSAEGALDWLLENGGMRATRKHRVDVFSIREPDGWTLYFVRRGSMGAVMQLDYGTDKVTRRVRKRRPESHWWPSVVVFGMAYQVAVPDIAAISEPVEGHAWGLGYTKNRDPEETIDEARGLLLRRKHPHTIYFFADGRMERETWTDAIYTYDEAGVLTGTRIEQGQVDYGYDLTTRKMTRAETIVTAIDTAKGLAGETIKHRIERWEYGQITLPGTGTIATIQKLHTVTEQTLNESDLGQGLRTTLEERMEVIRSGNQILKRYTRRQLNPKTGATETSGDTTELTSVDVVTPTFANQPGFRQEQRELQSGPDDGFKVFRFPAIGDQTWLDQVRADILDEAASWEVEAGFQVPPDLRIREGLEIVWAGAPSRWGVRQFLVLHRRLNREPDGTIVSNITGLGWSAT